MAIATVDAAAATRTWTAGSGLAPWSLPDNWDSGVVPVAGDTVVFPATMSGLTDNDLGFIVFADVVFEGHYIVDGDPFGMSGTLSVSFATAGAVVIHNDIQLTSVVAQQMMVGTNDILLLTGTLGGGAGFQTTGSGELQLSGSSPYLGVTTVVAGDLVVRNSQALGSSADGTEVLPGGQIVLEATVNGESLHVAAGNPRPFLHARYVAVRTWSGPITLMGDSRVSSAVGGVLRLAGAISGPGTLNAAAGTTELAGAGTYTDGTTVGAAQLRLGASHVLPDTGTLHIGGTFLMNGQTDEIEAITASSAASNLFMGNGTLTVAPLHRW